MNNNIESNEEIHEQKNFDEKAKSFFKDKKNIAIIILSILVIMFAGTSGNLNNSTNTVETSANVLEEETTASEDITNQLKEANEKITSLENTNKALYAELDETKQKVATLETNNQTLTEEKEQLTAKVNNMSSIEELQKTIDEKNSYILNLEAQVGTLTAEKSQLEVQKGILEQQLSNTSTSTSSVSSSKNTSSSNMKSSSYTVYVTNTGSKYHRGGCSYLRSSSHAIDKNSAISQGYTACSRCNP